MVKVIVKKELCIIHIGMPKTGSSTIQQALNKCNLGPSISYVKLSEINHSVPIYSLFAKKPANHHQHISMGLTEEEIYQYNHNNKKMLINNFVNGTSIQIISGEDIYHLTLEELDQFKLILEQYFKKILIVAYIRAPISFMNSAFQQIVKMDVFHEDIFSHISPVYQNKLEKFDILFGRENVKLFEFKSNNFYNNDVVSDFCFNLNIPIKGYKPFRTNESISKEAITLLYTYTEFGRKVEAGKDKIRLNNLLINTIQNIGHKSFSLSKKFVENNLNYNDVQWIEERMNIKFLEEIKDSDESINTKEDLFNFSDNTISELKKLIGTKNISEETLKNNTEVVVKLMGDLEIKLADELGINRVSSKQEDKNILTAGKNVYDLLNSFGINWNNYHEINKIDDISVDPIKHYIKNWNTSNLLVDDIFDTFYYLEKYPDIKKAKINPLLHYFRHGKREGRIGIGKDNKFFKRHQRCIVHIGMHKTGSSSIQDTLSSMLKGPDFFYINLKNPNHSAQIFSLFSESPEKYHTWRKRNLSKKDVDEINRNTKEALLLNIYNTNAKNYIISGEDISVLSEIGLKKLKSFLDKYFEEVVIIGYIRSPWSFIESAFQQMIKGGFNKFDLNAIYPEYRNRFEKFDLVFGRKNVHLIKFDSKSLIGGDVVLDFCNIFNIEIDPKNIKKVNESISKEILSLLYCNLKFSKVQYDNNLLIKMLSGIGNNKFKLAQNLITPILDKHQEDIEWIEKRVGKSFLELRTDDDNSIVSEDDFLTPDKISIEKLKKIIDKEYLPDNISGKNAEEVAILVDSLRLSLVRKNQSNISLAIGTIFKNEFDYIVEWMAWHKIAGFENFYIADNYSTDGTMQLLEAFEDLNWIHMMYQPKIEKEVQLVAYNRIVEQGLKDKIDAILFIDADEFLTHNSMVDGSEVKLLRKLLEKEDVGSVGIHWRTFGSSNHIKQTSHPVVQRFNLCKDDIGGNEKKLMNNPNQIMKSITKLNAIEKVHVHFCHLKDSFNKINVLGNKIKDFIGERGGQWQIIDISGRTKDVIVSPLRLNHYVIKSRDEYMNKKCNGGDAMKGPEHSRGIKYFETHDFKDTSFSFPEDKIHRLKKEMESIQSKLVNETAYGKKLKGDIFTFSKSEIIGWIVDENGHSKDLYINIFKNGIFLDKVAVNYLCQELKDSNISAEGLCEFRWYPKEELKKGDIIEIKVRANIFSFSNNKFLV